MFKQIGVPLKSFAPKKKCIFLPLFFKSVQKAYSRLFCFSSLYGCFWTLSQSIWSWHSSSFPLWQLKDQFRNLRFVLVQPVGSSWPGPVAWTSLDDLARNSWNVNVGRIKRLTFKRWTKQKKSMTHKSKSSNSSRNRPIKHEWKRQGVAMYKINFLLNTIWKKHSKIKYFWLRSIEGVQFRFFYFTSHFNCVQIFQMYFYLNNVQIFHIYNVTKWKVSSKTKAWSDIRYLTQR